VLRTLAIENYRSLRQFCVSLSGLNVITGANGSGKSSLYRALRLLADGSVNGMVAALAREGGLPSTLWAGPEKIGQAVREGRYPIQGTAGGGKPVGLRLGFADDDFGYAIDLGLPAERQTAFSLDPEIKRESVWTGPLLRPSAVLCDRLGSMVRVRQEDGTWSSAYPIRAYDSMLSEFADPERAPELLALRERIRSWRFYDHLRTDAGAPARRSQIGTRTPVLGHDGSDLAAALQTIREIGADAALESAVDLAFPGSRLTIDRHEDGRLALGLSQHGLLRPLGVAELSEGTLRYLLWMAALLSPRPPSLLVLNEPETSLHSDLLPALAQLISHAAAKAQTIVVSHSAVLIDALRAAAGADDADFSAIELTKEFGETRIIGQEPMDQPTWRWPKR
jgi:predicted ATPase